MAEQLWVRTRFYANPDDYRPIYEVKDGHPGLGPYWCSGYSFDPDRSIIIAFVQPEVDVTRYWPEAEDIDPEDPGPIRFSDRFPEPQWWPISKENPESPNYRGDR